ncbi:hypothetical protein PRZ48_015034 [Zasmidium cellare]|uniref:Cyclin n=1 Tax=Zasmidium cellare TaxID=395010 RepID=A0ABR0DXG6_ZASCE|nr:hypothetical protein PRZ48_015034 [Zasmidium cellare]
MAPISEASHLLNPLATSLQLETSASQLDGVPKDVEDSVRFETARLVQAAGILLRLPQEIIAQAIVTLQRFWTGPDGGSLLEHDSKDVAAAALYLTAKPSPYPISPRQVLTSFEYLSSLQPGQLSSTSIEGKLDSSWHLSDGEYEIARNKLYDIESHILRVVGFQTHVALPHTLCINYLQTLDVFQSADGSMVAKTAFAHLNSALLSPQLIYLTHQPSAIATAAIYLAAKEVGVKMPEVEWWEVFDLDREELGFLVVALRSIEGFALEHQRTFGKRAVPMTVPDLQVEIERSRMLEAGG